MTNGLKQLTPELNPDGNAVINTLQQLAGAIGTSIITTIVAASQAKLPDDLATATASFLTIWQQPLPRALSIPSIFWQCWL